MSESKLLKSFMNFIDTTYQRYTKVAAKERKIRAVVAALKELGYNISPDYVEWDNGSLDAFAEVAPKSEIADKLRDIIQYDMNNSGHVESVSILVTTGEPHGIPNERYLLGDVLVEPDNCEIAVYKKVAETEIGGVKVNVYIKALVERYECM